MWLMLLWRITSEGQRPQKQPAGPVKHANKDDFKKKASHRAGDNFNDCIKCHIELSTRN